jgi:hypothetical protein
MTILQAFGGDALRYLEAGEAPKCDDDLRTVLISSHAGMVA